MSVRQIPPNRRSVTGAFKSRKNGQMVQFESSLERDFVTILEFDDTVQRYESQPLRLDYFGPDHRPRRGYPDFLVHRDPHVDTRPLLCDVKFRREIFERWSELKVRLKAAYRYARERGWTYRLKTEVEIRTPYLTNAKFLLPYARCSPDPDQHTLLAETLSRMESATPKTLLAACGRGEWDQAQLMPTLWCLLGQRRFGMDLDQPLTMNSDIWHLRMH